MNARVRSLALYRQSTRYYQMTTILGFVQVFGFVDFVGICFEERVTRRKDRTVLMLGFCNVQLLLDSRLQFPHVRYVWSSVSLEDR